ncbi:MAG: hypothetical protein KGO02_19155 [Alphaproteobacteria bacterium]|nr:hypothetical protein [Alphaproteobacteria bacterium]
MSPRRLLYAAEFVLRLLAFFLPRHRWRIQRLSYAVRGFGGLLVFALAFHQAQLARLRGHYSGNAHTRYMHTRYTHTRHHMILRRRARYAPTAYRAPRRSAYTRDPGYSRYPRYPQYPGFGPYAGYRPYYRVAAPCTWTPYYPYRSCAPYPYQY